MKKTKTKRVDYRVTVKDFVGEILSSCLKIKHISKRMMGGLNKKGPETGRLVAWIRQYFRWKIKMLKFNKICNPDEDNEV